jgi:hypothetical protein
MGCAASVVRILFSRRIAPEMSARILRGPAIEELSTMLERSLTARSPGNLFD